MSSNGAHHGNLHPLRPERTAERRTRTLAALSSDVGADAVLVVSDAANIAYLSGVTGSNGMLLLGPDGAAQLATDFRYIEQAKRESPDVALIEDRDVLGACLKAAGDAESIVVEVDHLTAAQWRRALDLVGEARLIAGEGRVEKVRRVKDNDELRAIEQACAIAERALQVTLPTIAVGDTERLVAARLEFAIKSEGGHAIAFPTIVAAGENSAIPHHQPSRRELRRGDLLKVDFGAVVDGYHSDITRTFVVGSEPTDWQRGIHALVADAQRRAREAVRPGVDLNRVDAAGRDPISAAGHADHFGHGLGHGVGLQIHEWPIMTPRATGTLEAGMAITVEPGVYLPGQGGVRIEDTVVVTDSGVRSLTMLSRDLLRIG